MRFSVLIGFACVCAVLWASAASAQTQGLSAAQTAQLNAEIDKIITVDSSSWLFNRYNRGSARDAQIENYDVATGRAAIVANYTYNGSMRGWIRVRFVGEQVDCVEYHDFRGTCRPIGQNPAAYLVLGGLVGAALGGGSGAPAGDQTSTCRWVQEEICPPNGGPCRVRNVERCS